MGARADETRCAACGEELPATSRFCLQCGAPVATTPEAEVRKTVTLLFCDVSGSTAMGEQLDPEALRAVMGRYFAVASAAVERHGGTVEKFVGDAVLAVFGIPEVREDDALRAVRAAAEMRDALAELSAELLTSHSIRLAVRTGVNTGSVVSGTARAGGSFATGDAVNTAARLEQAAAPNEVLLGASTLSLVRDAVEVEAVEPLSVKGKAEPLPAYRLVRVLDVEHGRSRRLDAVLVGREREWRALTDSLARARSDGRGQLITVLGSAGMGKTRLIEQFLADVGEDVRVLRGRCLSYGRGITFWPVVQLLRQAASLSGDESEDAARAAMEATLAGCADAAAVVDRVLPLMGHGGEPGSADETFWAVRTVFEHLASAAPVVVAIDDLHWAEPTLLELIERVRDDARDVPLLLVCQARPELLEQRPGWGGGAINALTFNLEPLTVTETASLLEGLLGPGVPAKVAETVDAWAGGNPLFVEEVATHLMEAGLLVSGPDGWTVVGDLSSVVVPASVSTLLAARLERLPADERSLVERIAVVGLEITTAEAVALAPETPDVPRLLADLVRHDVLRRTRGARADTWAFRHVLVREAAYDALTKSLRAELHEQYADLLTGSSADAAAEVAAFIGHHLEQAASYRLELTPGHPAAVALAERAAQTLATASTHARAADDLHAALDLLGRALSLTAPDSAVRPELLLLQLDLLYDQGRYVDMQDVVEELRQALPDPDTHERVVVEALALAARSNMAADVSPVELGRLGQQAAALCRAADDRIGLARALRAQVAAAQMAGRWEVLRAVVRELDEIANPQDKRHSRGMLIACYLWGPAPASAGVAYVRELLDQPGLTPREAVQLRAAYATLLSMEGRREEAYELLAADAAVREAFDPFERMQMAFYLVELYAANDDKAAAIEMLDGSIDGLRASGGLAYASTLLAWKAALLLEQGGAEEIARRVVDEANELTSQYDSMSIGLVECCRAVLAAREGLHEVAGQHVTRALEAIDETDQPAQMGDIRRWLSEVPARRGDHQGQRRLLEQALEAYRSKGYQPLAARTERLLAELSAR